MFELALWKFKLDQVDEDHQRKGCWRCVGYITLSSYVCTILDTFQSSLIIIPVYDMSLVYVDSLYSQSSLYLLKRVHGLYHLRRRRGCCSFGSSIFPASSLRTPLSDILSPANPISIFLFSN